jgi:hypothetical protein
MKKAILFIILIPFINYYSLAQTFNISEVDPSGYNEVKASFTAYDKARQPYEDLDVSDFRILENDVLVPDALKTIECNIEMPLNVVLVLDRSTSMNDEIESDRKWDWVVDGAKTFVNVFEFGADSKIATMSFNGFSYIHNKFTDDRQDLLDSLELMSSIWGINGNTNFNVVFLDPVKNAVDLLKERPIEHRRAIVFLTDGKHESQTEELLEDEILEALTQHNIQLYAITLLDETNAFLKGIAEETGGEYFVVDSKDQLGIIYQKIAENSIRRMQCILTWQAPDLCYDIERNRTADITFLRTGDERKKKYLAPADALMKVDIDETIYDFGNPAVDTPVDRTIKFTPSEKKLIVDNIDIQPGSYFEIINFGFGQGVQPNYPFEIQPGTEWEIEVRFTQKSVQEFRQATLQINSRPCPVEIPLVAGLKDLRITSPDEGDASSVCDTVKIEWIGIEPETPVNLYYSTDGQAWQNIAYQVTGRYYNWFPAPEMNGGQIRIETSDEKVYKWVFNFGGSGNDGITSITLDANELYTYSCGYYTGNIQVGNTQLKNYGGTDIVIMKHDIDGNLIWAKYAGSEKGDDKATGIVITPEGRVFVTGIAFQGIMFDSYAPPMQEENKEYMFLAEYAPDGSFIDVKVFGAASGFSQLFMRPERLKYKIENSNGRIIVEGEYKGEYLDIGNNIYLPGVSNFTEYSALYNLDLNILSINPTPSGETGFSTNMAVDKNRNEYVSGNYSDSRQFGNISINSNGKTDGYIYRYGRNPIAYDTSGYFDVVVPYLTFSPEPADFGECLWGDSTNVLFTGLITNPTKVPVTIDSAIIDGGFKNDFTLLTDLTGKVINPGESIDVEIKFKPGWINERYAFLTVYPDCGSEEELRLVGTGVCGGDALAEYDFGKVGVLLTEEEEIECIFENKSNFEITINPRVRGTNINDFIIEIPGYGESPQDPIKVGPKKCITITVKFTPRGIGPREAYINYRIDEPCENAFTNLYGEGVDSDVLVTDYTWNTLRTNGTYTGTITLTNNSIKDANITNVAFENPGVSVFEFDSPTSFTLDAQGSRDIDVRFIPADDINYIENILFTIENKEEPAISRLEGTGFEPELTAEWICGPDVTVGQSNTSYLRLTNPADNSELTIRDITFREINQEFVWQSGTNPVNETILPGQTVDYPVTYTPQANSNHLNTIDIYSDNYDAAFTDEWKLTSISTSCDGINLEYNTPLDFNSIEICDNNSRTITVENLSKEAPITLYSGQVFISGPDAAAFTVDLTADVEIPAGESRDINVTFNPVREGFHEAEVNIGNSAGIEIIVGLSGTGNIIVPSSTISDFEISTGGKYTWPLSLYIPQNEKGYIEEIRLRLEYSSDVVYLMEGGFKNEITSGNWNWSQPVILPNGLEVTGTGNLPLPYNGNAFSLDFLGLLNLEGATTITATVIYDCGEYDYNLTNVTVDEVCINPTRQIISSGIPFGLDRPSPNPASSQVNFEFSVGFEVLTQIEIFDLLGNKVKTISNEKMQAGYYEASLSTSGLTSGVYMIRMISGPFQSTERLVIE